MSETNCNNNRVLFCTTKKFELKKLDNIEDHYIIGKLLYSSDFAQVNKVKSKLNGKIYALKRTHKCVLTRYDRWPLMMNQLCILQKGISHPNLIGVHDLIDNHDNFFQVAVKTTGLH